MFADIRQGQRIEFARDLLFSPFSFWPPVVVNSLHVFGDLKAPLGSVQTERAMVWLFIAVESHMHIQRAFVLCRETADVAPVGASVGVDLPHMQISVRNALVEPAAEMTWALCCTTDEVMLVR